MTEIKQNVTEEELKQIRTETEIEMDFEIALHNYHVLCDIQPYQKLIVSSDNCGSKKLKIDNRWGQFLVRKINGDSKEDILFPVLDTIELIYLTNKHLNVPIRQLILNLQDTFSKTYPEWNDMYEALDDMYYMCLSEMSNNECDKENKCNRKDGKNGEDRESSENDEEDCVCCNNNSLTINYDCECDVRQIEKKESNKTPALIEENETNKQEHMLGEHSIRLDLIELNMMFLDRENSKLNEDNISLKSKIDSMCEQIKELQNQLSTEIQRNQLHAAQQKTIQRLNHEKQRAYINGINVKLTKSIKTHEEILKCFDEEFDEIDELLREQNDLFLKKRK